MYFVTVCDNTDSLHSQGKLDMINVDKAVEFVLSCMNFDGGFGCRPGSESHAGQVGLQLFLMKYNKKIHTVVVSLYFTSFK